MAVVCPNIEDSPSYDAMAVRDSVDYFALTSDTQSYVVVNGMNVTGTGTMNVAVAGGAVAIGGQTYNYAGGSVSITAASVSDRRDTVVYTASVGVQVIAGQPCGYTSGVWTKAVTSNNPPVKSFVGTYGIPANSVILAEVYVANNTTTITTATNVVDKRNIQSFSGSAPLEQLIRSQSLDQMAPPAADLNFNGKRMTNVSAPVWPTDAAVFSSVLAPNTVTTNAPGSSASISVAQSGSVGATMFANFTGLSASIASFTVTGTPVTGQLLRVGLTDNGTSRSVAWGGSFVNGDAVSLPTYTVPSTLCVADFIYNGSAFQILRGWKPPTGTLLGQTTVTATHAYSTSSSTMAAIDSTNMTVSFTATSTQALVTLDASAVYNSTGIGMQVWTLFAHGGTTVVGYYATVRDATTAAIDAIPGPARASILVTGLTAGTAYQYDWAWGVSTGTANMSTVVITSGAVSASNFGSATMSVFAA